MARTDHRAAYKAHIAKVVGSITPAIARKAAEAGAREAIRQIRLRNDKGLDVNGKKFKSRTARYMKRKPALMKKARGTFRATDPEQYMRLSGALYKAMSYKGVKASVTEQNVSMDFTLYIKKESEEKKLTGLRRMGYDPFPLAKPGTAQRRREDRAMSRRMKAEIGSRTGGAVVVNA